MGGEEPPILQEDPDQDGQKDPSEEPVLFSKKRAIGSLPGETSKGLATTCHQAMRNSLGALNGSAPPALVSQTFPLDAPAENLELDFVFGYRGRDCRQNLHFLDANTVVYNIAALGVVFDHARNSQRFYRGHNDDILCTAVNNTHDIVATGQIGHDPEIHLWNPTTMAPIARLKGHTHGIICLAFSPDGRFLVSIGQDDDFTIKVWDVATNSLISSQSGGKNKYLAIKFSNNTNFVAVGVKVIKFFVIEGRALTISKGILGDNGDYQTFTSIDYMSDGRPVVGTTSGHLYIFRGRNLTLVKKAGEGAVTALHPHPSGIIALTASRGISLFTVADKNQVQLAGAAGRLNGIEGAPRAIAVLGPNVVIGTDKNEILKGTLNATPAGIAVDQPQVIMPGHVGELWGQALCPRNATHVATCGDDGTVRRWDFGANRPLEKMPIAGKARVMDISPDGNWMAVGTEEGKVFMVDTNSRSVRPIGTRVKAISEIKFSPDGNKLAVGSHEFEIDVYTAPEWRQAGTLRGHHSTITHFDWAKNGEVLRSNCTGYELLFWDMNAYQQITSASAVAGVEWATNHCVICWTVKGMWPEASDGTDINQIDVNPTRPLLAMGDDFRAVELTRFPCIDKAAAKKRFTGHSEHVTNVRWSRDGNTLISLGGLDAAVMVWRLR